MRRLLIVLLATALLSGCGVFRPETSWVDDVANRDAAQLSLRIAEVAASRLAPGDRVRLASHRGNGGEAMSAHMKAALQSRGLTVVEGSSDAHALRYVVSRYGEGLLLRVRLDDAEATTVLKQGRNGELITSTPLTLRKVSS
jgi:hypothetical protein